MNRAYDAAQWHALDQLLRDISEALNGVITCADQKPSPDGNFVFVWEGTAHVPRVYLIHGTVARRPRTFMPAGDRFSEWYEIVVAPSRDDAAHVKTVWAATPSTPSGVDAATWLQSLLTAAIPGFGALFPVQGDAGALQSPDLFVRMSRLRSDIAPAKVVGSVTVQVTPSAADIPNLAGVWSTALRAVHPDGMRPARQLLESYMTAFAITSCEGTHPRACQNQVLNTIATIWNQSTCRSDSDCQTVTASAREWAASLPLVSAELRQTTFVAEPPKYWAIGAYVGGAAYPQSVANGQTLRVRVAGDSKLSADQFGRGVTAFVAAVAARRHQPDYWSLKNVGIHAGMTITPNVGVTTGLQWRVFRQIAVAGGPMWVWYPSGAIGTTISTSNPLRRKRVQAWTFGTAFMLDAR
jgi:hypothetical protein